ncbi:MAG: hypothetical protein ACRDJ5_09520 [Actinomycetota bacterium]
MHLPYWMSKELWACELEGSVLEQGHVIMADRGRLLGRVEAWDLDVSRSFAEACATRACKGAAALLGQASASREADELMAAETTKERGAVAGGLGGRFDPPLSHALGYAADACHFAPTDDPALAGFVTAHAAGMGAAEGGHDDEAFLAGARTERELQARWLISHLGLDREAPASF